MAWVYLLHFDNQYRHALHYGGATLYLQGRLIRHAHGRGSALCRKLRKEGIDWQLAACWQCAAGEAFAHEKLLKRQRTNRRFCPLCVASPARLGDAIPVDLDLLEFPTTSQELR